MCRAPFIVFDFYVVLVYGVYRANQFEIFMSGINEVYETHATFPPSLRPPDV